MARKKRAGKKNVVSANAERKRGAGNAAGSKEQGSKVVRNKRPTAQRPSNKQMGKMVSATLRSYAKLLADPCGADPASAILPGPSGGIAFRLPFRFSFSVPTNSLGIDGVTTYSNTGQTTLLATFAPHCMDATSGSAFFSVVSVPQSNSTIDYFGTSTFAPTPWQKNALWYDLPGISTIAGLYGGIRPIAACAKMSYMGGAGTYTGSWAGYSGPAEDIVVKSSSTNLNNQYMTKASWDNLGLIGNIIDSPLAGVQAVIDYANAAPQYQDFRETGIQNTSTYDTVDAVDANYSKMPVITLGGSNLTPGARVVATGAIVYEVFPKVTAGVESNYKRVNADPKAAAGVATWASKYLPLVTKAVDFYADNANIINGVATTALSALAL